MQGRTHSPLLLPPHCTFPSTAGGAAAPAGGHAGGAVAGGSAGGGKGGQGPPGQPAAPPTGQGLHWQAVRSSWPGARRARRLPAVPAAWCLSLLARGACIQAIAFLIVAPRFPRSICKATFTCSKQQTARHLHGQTRALSCHGAAWRHSGMVHALGQLGPEFGPDQYKPRIVASRAVKSTGRQARGLCGGAAAVFTAPPLRLPFTGWLTASFTPTQPNGSTARLDSLKTCDG